MNWLIRDYKNSILRGKASMVEPAWTEWRYFVSDCGTTIPRTSGNYEIRWAIAGQPQTIPRCNQADTSGLLYIGKGKSLRGRITKFFRCVCYEGQGEIKHFHSGAVTYLSFNFNRKIGNQDLQFRYCELPEREIRTNETKLLQQYAEMFLDKPPLNTVVRRQSAR